MSLTADQIQTIRASIGNSVPPSDDDLQAKFTRLGDLALVVSEVLNQRLQDALAGPASISIPGVYSENAGQQAAQIEKQLVTAENGREFKAATRVVRRGRSRSGYPY